VRHAKQEAECAAKTAAKESGICHISIPSPSLMRSIRVANPDFVWQSLVLPEECNQGSNRANPLWYISNT